MILEELLYSLVTGEIGWLGLSALVLILVLRYFGLPGPMSWKRLSEQSEELPMNDGSQTNDTNDEAPDFSKLTDSIRRGFEEE